MMIELESGCSALSRLSRDVEAVRVERLMHAQLARLLGDVAVVERVGPGAGARRGALGVGVG
jgi:hypothetical protein